LCTKTKTAKGGQTKRKGKKQERPIEEPPFERGGFLYLLTELLKGKGGGKNSKGKRKKRGTNPIRIMKCPIGKEREKTAVSEMGFCR